MVEIGTVVTYLVYAVFLGYIVKFVQYSDELPLKNFQLTVANTTFLDPSITTLTNRTGHLLETGWYPHPFKTINKDELHPGFAGFTPLTFMRFKEFEYHTLNSGDYTIFFALANVGYSGSALMGIFNWKTNELETDNSLILPWKIFALHEDKAMKLKHNQDYSSGNGLKLSYSDKYDYRHVAIRSYVQKSEKLDLEAKFNFELKLFEDGSTREGNEVEGLSIEEGHMQIEKIDDEGKFWHLGYKHYGLVVNGEIVLKKSQKDKQEKIILNPKNDLMMIDHGVGLFQYKTHWIWVSANFYNKEGKRMGFNFGGGMAKTDKSKASEDFFTIEGKTTLLEPVDVQYDLKTLGETPWRFETKDKDFIRKRQRSVQLDFLPQKTFKENINFFVIRSKLVQIFGYFSGTIVGDDGKEYEIESVKGLADFHYAQW